MPMPMLCSFCRDSAEIPLGFCWDSAALLKLDIQTLCSLLGFCSDSAERFANPTVQLYQRVDGNSLHWHSSLQAIWASIVVVVVVVLVVVVVY